MDPEVLFILSFHFTITVWQKWEALTDAMQRLCLMFSVKYLSWNRNIFSLIETLAVLETYSSVLVGWSSVQLHFSDRVLRIGMQIHRIIYIWVCSVILLWCFTFVIAAKSFCSRETFNKTSSRSSQWGNRWKGAPWVENWPAGFPVALATRSPHCFAAPVPHWSVTVQINNEDSC